MNFVLWLTIVTFDVDRDVAINIKSDSIVRQTNEVHLLSYITRNNKHTIYYIK